jgi:hypothetical protein
MVRAGEAAAGDDDGVDVRNGGERVGGRAAGLVCGD